MAFVTTFKKEDVIKLCTDKLAESDIPIKQAKTLGLSFLMPSKTKELVNDDFPSIRINYHNIKGEPTKFNRFRLFGNIGKKYTQPQKTLPQLYFPPNINWQEINEDIEQPIIFTEGEFKALCASYHDFPTIALGGVWNWKAQSRYLDRLPEFEYLNLDNRNVYLCFDSDLHENDKVLHALYEFSAMLTALGAILFIIELPAEDDQKVGLDDYLVAHGTEAFNVLLDEAIPYSPSKALYELNSEVAYIQENNSIIKLKNGKMSTVSDFKNGAYANRMYTEPSVKYTKLNGKSVAKVTLKEKSAAEAWIKWPKRRELNNVVYEPNQPRIADNNFNLWKGWGCEPKAGSVKPWKDLIDYFFKKDKDAREWFENWCAYQFQHPGEKLYTAACLWSVEQGTGKSLVGYTLIKLFGDNGGEVKQRDLHSAYNDWAVHKQFIMGDEITGSNKKSDNDLLKGLITQKTVNVNQKYVPVYTIRDTINYLFTSNHPDAFYMEDTDRRLFVHEITDKPLSDEFYQSYDEWLNGDGASHLFQYFLDRDINGFNAKSRALVTEAKKEMKMQTKSELGMWIYELLQNGLHFDSVEIPCELFTPAQLADAYNRKATRPLSSNAIGRELKRQGVPQLPSVNIKGKMYRLYPIKNISNWKKRSNKAIATHYLKHNS